MNREHVFAVYAHEDMDEAMRLVELLNRYWSARSEIYLYVDGKDVPSDLPARTEKNVTLLVHAPFEADRCAGLMKGLSRLNQLASRRGMQVLSFLQTDMIPTDDSAFYDFVSRFSGSGKVMTFCPSFPKGAVPDAGNLHFSVPAVREHRLLPVERHPSAVGSIYDFFEFQLARSFAAVNFHWRLLSYPLWKMTFHNGMGEGFDHRAAVFFYSLTPETSILRTPHKGFWDHYEKVFLKRRGEWNP